MSFENCVHEWNGRQEIFSLPQAIENSRQFLVLRTDILLSVRLREVSVFI